VTVLVDYIKTKSKLQPVLGALILKNSPLVSDPCTFLARLCNLGYVTESRQDRLGTGARLGHRCGESEDADPVLLMRLLKSV